MTGQWPVSRPINLDVPAQASAAGDGERWVQRAQERALHEMVLDSIAADLAAQPSPTCVLTAARNWCSRITAAAEDIARTKRSTS